MLLHVVASFRFGVGEISHEADGRHVLLVLAPRDALIFEEVHYRRDVDGYLSQVIIVHSKIVTADRSYIIGLRRMGQGIVVLQSDALLREPSEVGLKRSIFAGPRGGGENLLTITGSLVKVGVFQPDRQEPIEHFSFDM